MALFEEWGKKEIQKKEKIPKGRSAKKFGKTTETKNIWRNKWRSKQEQSAGQKYVKFLFNF
jgi:hypothetical protein